MQNRPSGQFFFPTPPEIGEEKWRFETGGYVSCSAIVSDSTIYVGSDDNHLYAIEGESQLVDSPWPKFRNNLRNTGRKEE